MVVPRHKGDVQAVIELANRLNISILPRGGGTSLAGQAVGHSIVLDFSKYMQNVLEVNKEELWCRVQPGLVQDELNAHVRAMGLQFGPDTSTSNRATIGGMIGNNSAGAHSLTYGKTLDHVIELTVLLADGSEVVLKDLSPETVESKSRADTIEGRAYREVFRLAQQYRSEILARYPKIMRRVSGYNLDEFVKAQPFNLSRMIVGLGGHLGDDRRSQDATGAQTQVDGDGRDSLQRRYRSAGVRAGYFANPSLRDGIHRQDGFESCPRQHRAIAQAGIRAR